MRQLKRLVCRTVHNIRATLSLRIVSAIVPGTAITIFGIYNVHQQADIAEGDTLGLILLFNFWLDMSSSILSPLLGTLSYALGFKYPEKKFLETSISTTICMAGFFWLWRLFSPVLPSLAEYPLTVALMGGCFIGTDCSLVIRRGAPCAGDDALALVTPKITGYRILRAYLFMDITISVFLLSYIPAKRIVYSLIIVTVSSFLTDFIQNFGMEEDDGKDKKEYGIAVQS